jgi:penicillin-binding protein 2
MDLKLTVDLDIQRAAELALGARNGAVIAMDPHTGEVLALVSHPSFNPNDFAVRVQRDIWNKLITDPNHPLMNKAIQDQLAPGSTFKLIMSVAGLHRGRHLLRPLLCVRCAPWRGQHRQCHSVLLRHLLLHAGAAARD